MMSEENKFVNHLEDNSQSTENNQPQTKPIREGEPMGGHNFGKTNTTGSGDDKNNPSQNAGYTNEYFRRNEPSEEHPENTNFKVTDQEGAPDYDSANGQQSSNGENGEVENNYSNTPNPQVPYREGTADDDGKDTNRPSRADIDPHLL